MQDDVTNAPAGEEPQDPAISKDMPAPEPAQSTDAPADTSQEEALAAEEQPTAAPSQSEPEESREEVDWSQYVPRVSAPLPVNEEGQVDPQQYKEQLKQEMRFEQNEIRTWQKLEGKYPEIGKDAGLREMILANRLFDVQNGGRGTLEDSAARVFERIGMARNEGKAAQATSITVQKSAALGQPTGNQVSSLSPDVTKQIRSGDQTAIHSTLSQWIKDGKI